LCPTSLIGAKHFNYNLNLKSCLGDDHTGSGKFYPDWDGSNKKCIQDVVGTLAPDYMSQFGTWFFETLQDCCSIHYGYNMNECLGEAATGTNKYYVDWTTYKCVKDCSEDGADCGGLAEGWELGSLYITKEECCRQRLGYDIDHCME
jgi:hypothetical protein